MRYFFECCFSASEYFDTLDTIIKQFKSEHNNTQHLFITELYHIIQTKNYKKASHIIEKYSRKKLNLELTEKVIVYIYNKLLNQPASLDTQVFYRDCKVVFCPICTPDPEFAIMLNLIYKATIITNNLQIYICKPCKLVWLTENIHADNAQDYKKFMKLLGLKGLWKELSSVDYL